MMNHDDLVIDIKAMLKKAKTPVIGECCIYRVPYDIRRANEDAYTPKVVSIGPFHHNGHPRLNNMESQKLSYCNSFLERTQTNLDIWIRYIQDVEPNFRNCYSDNIEFTKEELTKIIFVDSAFIFELFLLSYYCDTESLPKYDWVLSKPYLDSSIKEDLLLLENQLPFFVLEHLFNLSFASRSDALPSFLGLTFYYFDFYNSSKLKFNDISTRHFTDLIRTFQLQYPLEKRPPRTSKTARHLPSATELSEAGVIFKVKTESTSLLDLTFSRRIFEIPRLGVYDDTELLFRNIVALEQCHYPFESYITDYFLVWDFLVNTGKDVDILVQKKVLVSWLGDNDSVANLFNRILKNTNISMFNDHYSQLCQDLNYFYENPWNKLNSTLKRDYCGSPWQTAASIAAIILLILSLVQTVCSILQVIQQ